MLNEQKSIYLKESAGFIFKFPCVCKIPYVIPGFYKKLYKKLQKNAKTKAFPFFFLKKHLHLNISFLPLTYVIKKK